MNARLSTHVANPHRLPVSISACIAVLISVALLPSTARALPGDMNCDGAVNVADIPLFVDALLSTGSFGGCDITRADMNADTRIDGNDIQPFATELMPPPCPAGFALCGGVCRDLQNDNDFCGSSCDNARVCTIFETCTGGICQPLGP